METQQGTKKNFMDKFVDKLTKFSEPMGKFASMPAVAALQDAFATSLVWIMIGSFFLIIYAMCTGQIGFTLLAPLAKYQNELYLASVIGMHFITIYVVVCIAISYGKRLGCDEMSTALVSLAVFFALNLNVDALSAGITLSKFNASNLFVGIFGTLLTVKLYSFFVKKSLTIKLPPQVPQNVTNAFTSLIPCMVIFPVAWLLRSIVGVDFSELIAKVVTPLSKIGDTIWSFTLDRFFSSCFWSMGIHYDNLMNSVLGPFQTMWLNENAAAVASGTAMNMLPHIWIGSVHSWCTKFCYAWPLWLMLVRSKAPGLKQFAVSIFVPLFFCICEPLWFGVPVVLNPIMMVGLIVNWTVGCGFITYLLFETGIFNRLAFYVPWATPDFLQGWIMTGGDWKVFILMAIEFVMGYILWYPFFKTYERQLLKKAKETELSQLST